MSTTLERTQLPNGLTVLAECNPKAHTSALGFFVQAGTRDEDRAVMGVSHFLEHMMFKGTARRSAADVNREFDDMGANYNAYTSHEATVYYAQVLPEFLPRTVDLLGDMLRPALRVEDFTVEKKVILEEIGMYEDRPNWRLNDRLMELHFAEHPMSFRVLGTAQTITDLDVEQMRAYFAHRYSPQRIIVAAAGKVDFDALVKDVQRIAGHWQATSARRAYTQPRITGGEESVVDPKLTRHYIEMLCAGPSAQDDQRFAASVLADVLGDDEGSRLYWALIDPGLADDADFSFGPMDQLGCFSASASCDPDRAAQVEALLLKTLDNYASSIDPLEIERSKNKIATALTLRSENPLGCMRSVGGQWLYRQSYLTLQEQLDRVLSVTPADIRTLLEKYTFQPRTLVRMGPR